MNPLLIYASHDPAHSLSLSIFLSHYSSNSNIGTSFRDVSAMRVTVTGNRDREEKKLSVDHAGLHCQEASIPASPSRRGSHSIDDSNRGEVSTVWAGGAAPIRISYSMRTPFIAAHNGRDRTHGEVRWGRGRDRTQASNAVVMTEVDSRVRACVLWDIERAPWALWELRALTL